jgi:hypothetical protein
MFISRSQRKSSLIVKPKADARKHKAIYYTVIFQEIEVNWCDAGPAVIAFFMELADHIFVKEKSPVTWFSERLHHALHQEVHPNDDQASLH